MKSEETVKTEERSKRERGDAQVVPTATEAAAKSTRSKRAGLIKREA